MKIRILTAALALLLLLGLTGCGAAQMAEPIDQTEDALAVISEDPVPAAAVPEATASIPTATSGLTRGDAEKIALDHAGFTADQVQYLHTEYEIDDGRPQYEVSFHQGRWEYDYEIDAETGKILSFEKDD